ncbi:hypothetical protein [Acinetobacter baumannii]|uniref:hypothetical protein n=1 Tax=Acinetobacter baumannii TaxID=470 RepID=UPI003A8A0869
MNTKQKRAQFTKDLDKLVSGDYVLVPKNPTKEMERVGIEVVGFRARKAYMAMVAAAQGDAS